MSIDKNVGNNTVQIKTRGLFIKEEKDEICSENDNGHVLKQEVNNDSMNQSHKDMYKEEPKSGSKEEQSICIIC